MINSIRKGKAGEREWSKFCREEGFKDVRRSQQYSGGVEESADCINLPFIHQEIKRVEKLNIDKAMEQAIDDSKLSKNIPIVAHRKNRKDWLVTMKAEHWFSFYRVFAVIVKQLNEGKGGKDDEST